MKFTYAMLATTDLFKQTLGSLWSDSHVKASLNEMLDELVTELTELATNYSLDDKYWVYDTRKSMCEVMWLSLQKNHLIANSFDLDIVWKEVDTRKGFILCAILDNLNIDHKTENAERLYYSNRILLNIAGQNVRYH